MFTLNRERVNIPEIFPFHEVILQAIIKQFLHNHLENILKLLNISELDPKRLEVLGEKALPEGHVDILVKEAIPIGKTRKIIVEVKFSKASVNDLKQTEKYMDELGEECISACLIARDFQNKVLSSKTKVKLVKYEVKMKEDAIYTFNELLKLIRLKLIK